MDEKLIINYYARSKNDLEFSVACLIACFLSMIFNRLVGVIIYRILVIVAIFIDTLTQKEGILAACDFFVF